MEIFSQWWNLLQVPSQGPALQLSIFSFQRIQYILKFWVWSTRKKSSRKPGLTICTAMKKNQLPCILSKSIFKPWCSKFETTCVKIRDIRLLESMPLSRCRGKFFNQQANVSIYSDVATEKGHKKQKPNTKQNSDCTRNVFCLHKIICNFLHLSKFKALYLSNPQEKMKIIERLWNKSKS